MDEQVQTKAPTSRKAAVLMTLLVLALLGVAVLANLWKSDLRVASTSVEGNAIVSEKDILALARIERDAKLFEVDLFAVRKNIERNPFVRSVSVNREVPNRLGIRVEERVPIAAVVSSGVYYLDAEGYVLPPVRSESIFDLPVLTGALQREDLTAGRQCVTTDAKDALSILRIAREVDDQLYRRISEVHVVTDRDIILYTAEFGVPVIFGRGDTAEKMLKLDAFWKEFVLRHGASELRYIDLRYRDQVVVRWSHDKNEMISEASKTTRSPS